MLRNTSIDCRESGSTAVTCARNGDVLTVANVGDSRCVMARDVDEAGGVSGAGGGALTAVDLSFDHKPRRNDELARIQRMNGVVEPARGEWGKRGEGKGGERGGWTIAFVCTSNLNLSERRRA